MLAKSSPFLRHYEIQSNKNNRRWAIFQMVKLWSHQISAIRIADYTPDLFLAYEQGTGKTRTAIEILRRRYAKEGRLMKTLIIAPVIVCDNWKKEFAMFSKIQPSDILVLTDSGAKRCKKMFDACGDDLSRAKIIITNYQGMLMPALSKMLLQWKPDILICDESQRVKSHSSKTSKAVQVQSDLAKYRLLLTGTPILNTPMDLWQQFRILDGGETFSKNFFAFRATYFRDVNSGWSSKPGHFSKWEPTEDTLPRIQERIRGKMLRVLKSECLDLPPLVRQRINVEMSPEQKRIYLEMRDEYLAFMKLNEGKHPVTVTAQLAITKALRLQQILSGYAPTEQTGIVHIEDNPRLKALSELLEDLTEGSKVIVWACFKENYKMIAKLCEKLGIEYAQIHGDISNKDRIDEMERFRKDPKCRVMVANQQAGGTGITLVEASYSVYYSKNFSLEQDLQSEARNHRGGSEIHAKITRIDLVCEGTIDDLINEALEKKQQIGEQILRWNI